MSFEQLPVSVTAPLSAILLGRELRTVASYENELAEHRNTEIRLRNEIAKDEDILRQKNQLIDQQELLSEEANHRLLNDLQLIVSLLSLQSRRSADAEAASQLAAAAGRVATIGRVHQRLHNFDSAKTIPLKRYLEDLCCDFCMLLSSEQTIAVEGIEIEVPAATGIPLSFIVNELITNAAKYGKGRITVRLVPGTDKGYALSVADDGPVLPAGFNFGAGKGQGMRIVQSFVDRIGGELRIGRADNDQGAQFTILFACPQTEGLSP